MALSSREQRRISNEASVQFRKKIKLEKSLRRKIDKFFRGQNGVIKVRLKNGEIYNAVEAVPELKEILNNHYRKTQATFVILVIKFLNKSLSRIVKGKKIEINDTILESTLRTQVVREVSNTTSKMSATTNGIIAKALIDLSRDNITDDNEKSKYVFDKLEAKRRGRANITAINETQKASEGAKSAASKEYNDMLEQSGNVVASTASGYLLIRMIKVWMDQFDKKVRPWHKDARFQEQNISDPFIVNGEQLMHPGDDSLGASSENTMGCRCDAITTFVI